jgi:hypothetical protein
MIWAGICCQFSTPALAFLPLTSISIRQSYEFMYISFAHVWAEDKYPELELFAWPKLDHVSLNSEH